MIYHVICVYAGCSESSIADAAQVGLYEVHREYCQREYSVSLTLVVCLSLFHMSYLDPSTYFPFEKMESKLVVFIITRQMYIRRGFFCDGTNKFLIFFYMFIDSVAAAVRITHELSLQHDVSSTAGHTLSASRQSSVNLEAYILSRMRRRAVPRVISCTRVAVKARSHCSAACMEGGINIYYTYCCCRYQ